MTYQQELLHNRYASMSLDIGKGLVQPQLGDLAQYLCDQDDGKHDQHLRMLGVKKAKELRL